MLEIVFATGNLNKLNEIKSVAEHFSIKILSPKDVSQKLALSNFEDPIESGSTYYENALIKAQACFEWSGLPSLGDDSGLEVSILNNAPGIYSARYGGEHISNKEKIELLLSEIKLAQQQTNSTDRSARFRSILAFVKDKHSPPLSTEGVLEGEILATPIHGRGFGYDPIVKIHEFNATLSQLDDSFVFANGFRARAAKKLFEQICS